MLILFYLNKKQKAEGPQLFTRRHLGFKALFSTGEWWMSRLQYCVYVCWSLWLCLRKHFPTNAAHNTYACYITTPIPPSLSPSLPNPYSFISLSLSLFNKAPIHFPANQSLHSCSQLSMTGFIWLGPSPSHQPSSISIFSVWKWDYHSVSHVMIGAYKRKNCLELQVLDYCLYLICNRKTFIPLYEAFLYKTSVLYFCHSKPCTSQRNSTSCPSTIARFWTTT